MASPAVVPGSRLTDVASIGSVLDGDPGATTKNTDSREILQLKRKVERLEGIVMDKDALIASLRAKNRQTTAELVEFQLQKLQKSLSEKDSSLAVVELKLKRSDGTGSDSKHGRTQLLSHVATLRAERNKLVQQFKSKVVEWFSLMRQDSEEMLGAVAREYGSCTRDQLCDELRYLDLTVVRLKSFIDQLLAVALETNPSLLEGMPRIQQNSGLKIELFGVASLTELLEELQEREENCQHLHHYASQLMQKLTEHAPELLLDSVLLPKWEELRKSVTVLHSGRSYDSTGQWEGPNKEKVAADSSAEPILYQVQNSTI